MRINAEYMMPAFEPVLMAALKARHILKWYRPRPRSNAVLIVNPCLIGEFAASVPAIREYILRHPQTSVDLLISPSLKPIAEHLRGVRKIYEAQSVFRRPVERGASATNVVGSYDEIIALRMSIDAYRAVKSIPARHIRTSALPGLWYGWHLLYCILLRKTPMSLQTLAFKILGVKERHLSFEEIIALPVAIAARIQSLRELASSDRKIIIHTGASWVLNRWPVDNWVAVLKTLNSPSDCQFIFVGNADLDRSNCDAIAAQLDFPVVSLIGKLTLLELLAVMRESDYFIGVDSGPRNLAHLVELPSITILGPGSHMFTPPDSRDIVLDRSRGRGLYQRFFDTARVRFIEQITPVDVAGAFVRLQSNFAKRPLTNRTTHKNKTSTTRAKRILNGKGM